MDSSASSVEVLSSPRAHETSQGSSTVITVASREGSALPFTVPFTASKKETSKAERPGRQSRSKSMSDFRHGLRKPPGVNSLRKEESRFLPSCQANRRKSSLGGAKSLSLAPQVVRKGSDTTSARSSVNSYLSKSFELPSGSVGDSGIASGEFLILSSVSAGYGESEPTLEDSGNKSLKQARRIKSLSEFEQVDDISEHSTMESLNRIQGGRQRNHSESELGNSLSVRSVSAVSLHLCPGESSFRAKHRSLESLNGTENATTVPDRAPTSVSSTAACKAFEERDPALQAASRADNIEHRNIKDNDNVSGSLHNNDSHRRGSWTSSGWRQAVKTRSSCSSEDSADDVFFSTEESVDDLDDVTDAFQTYLKGRTSETESRLERTSIFLEPNTAKPVSEKKDLVKTNSQHPSESVEESDESYLGASVVKSLKIWPRHSSKDKENILSSSGEIETGTSFGQTLSSTNSSLDEQYSECDTSQSLQAFLPHLQRTLTAARERIQSKKDSSTSKIPVKIKQEQKHPRQHIQSQTRDNQASTSASVNKVSSDDDRVICDSGLSSGPSVSTGTVSHKDFNNHSSQKSLIVSTAVTLEDSPAVKRSGQSGMRDGKIGETRKKVDPSFVNDENFSASDVSANQTKQNAELLAGKNGQKGSGREEARSAWTKTLEVSLEEHEAQNQTVQSSEEDAERHVGTDENSQQTNKSESAETGKQGKSNAKKDKPVSRRHSRKKCSRVEFLLNNDLFKKHLSGHIDIVERNILRNKKFGLKKSFSNLDLTSMDSEKVQAAFDSSLKVQDIELDNSFMEESEIDELGVQNGDESDTVFNGRAPTRKKRARNTTQESSHALRRKSLACDDSSLQQLHEVFRQGKSYSTPVFAPTRRGRLHIPSFDEFRKQRQSNRDLVSDNSHLEDPADDAGNVSVVFTPLETITEDDSTDMAKSLKCSNVEAEDEIRENDEDIASNVDTVSEEPSAKINLEDENTGNNVDTNISAPSENSAIEKENGQLSVCLATESEVLRPDFHAKQDMLEEKETSESSSSGDGSEKHLYHSPRYIDSVQPGHLNKIDVSSTGDEAQKHSETLTPPTSFFQVDSNETSNSSSNNDSQSPFETQKSEIQQSVPTERRENDSASTTEDQILSVSEIVDSQDISLSQEDDICDTPSGKTTDLSSAHGGSYDLPLHDDVSDEEVLCDDDNDEDNEDDEGVRQWPMKSFPRDFPFPLFEESALSLDTVSWARLFIKTFKPRRKDRGAKKQGHVKGSDEKPNAVPVLRSSSDVTSQMTSSGQKGQRKRRLRKERPYKSDPLADGGGALTSRNNSHISSEQSRDGEEAVFLAQAEMKRDSQASSFPSLEELTEESSCEDLDSDREDGNMCPRGQKRLSNISTASEDSGVVGQDAGSPEPAASTLGPLFPLRQTAENTQSKIMNCLQCCPNKGEMSGETGDVTLCDKCLQRQQERRETIYEIIETEINYGRDLRILKEEFYVPMQTTGLLSAEQLESVFINLDDLISINTQLTEKLRSALHNAAQADDQELSLVNIGSLFIESSTMFLAFENYCINQAQASASLEQLERERELLRIFLQVSQAENGLLRRMHLKSFLMVPVQRIMKYPLLLNRLYKATPPHHSDKEDIRQAREKIEDILVHINAKAKTSTGSLRGKRKQSELRRYSLTEKIEVNRVALEVLGWNQKEVSDLITSRMWYAQPSDHTWASKRCRNVKFVPVHAVLFTCRQNQNHSTSTSNNNDNSNNNNNMDLGQQAAVVLVREKSGKYQAVRDPFLLEKSVVTVDPDCDDVFELQEWGREAYIFKAEDPKETHVWVQHLRQQTHNLGQWRRRRNALPNIMLKNV